ncbi:MAG: morB [Rhizobacter sp.]|nr:morB [Rhizobacter sp.]
MPTLFDPIKVGDLDLANRIVMAPLTRDRSPRAVPTRLAATYYAQRASAGLIISEGTAISQEAQGFADVPGLYEPEQVSGWKTVTAAVHAACGKIVCQLWHVGRISHVSLQANGNAPVAPSAIEPNNARTFLIHANGSGEFVPTSMPRILERAELPRVIEDYRRAARAAIDAGFDGVEIHAANGFLLDQFLRTSTNLRTDDHGGSIENRARFVIEVVKAVCDEVGSGRVGIRFSPVSPINDSFDPDPQALFAHVVSQLAPLRIAYVHVVEGQTGGPRDFRAAGNEPFDWAALRAVYKAAGGAGAWMGNNGYDKALAQSRLASGDVDLVAFGVKFLANPDLVRRFREDAPLNNPDPSTFFGGDGGPRGYTDYPPL